MKILDPENIDFQCIHNILFDWGGVITNIDHHKTIEAFKILGIKNFEDFFSHSYQNMLFRKFEIGAVSAAELREELRKLMNKNASDEEIDTAWCELLLDTPAINIEILKTIGPEYNLFLLSNTNEIHANYYNNKLSEQFKIDFPMLFKKVYYSHTSGMRKPDEAIFEYVLSDAGISAQETLFIDDTLVNIDIADKLGFQSFFVQNGIRLQDIFKKFLK